jgi:hypothetical protein
MHEVLLVSGTEKALVIILRVLGGIVLLALLAVIMPHSCMETTNRWLGLGELPDTAIVGYLTRSLSVMYAMHGALLVYLSCNVRRFAPVIRFFAAVGVVFGVIMLGIDLAVGMPWWWTWGEGPFVVPVYALVFWLATRVERTGADS